MKRLRILCLPFSDEANLNAQCLNVREIAARLPADRFQVTFFHVRKPDPRLARSGHRSLWLPPRLGLARVLVESARGYDLLFKPLALPRLLPWLPLKRRFLGDRPRLVEWLEHQPHISAEGDLRAYAGMDAVAAITQHVHDAAAGALGPRLKGVIPVGVDTGLFSPPAARDHARPIVLTIGTILPRKRQELVLEAAARNPGTLFVLIGKRRGDYADILLAKARELGLTNFIIEPPLPQPDLAARMRAADVLLHPSLSEGLPKVVLEAAATGLPAIHLDHYRAPSVVDGVTGFQCADDNGMLDRLDLLLRDAALRRRMGEAAVAHARAFDWDEIARKWRTVFEETAA